MSHDNQILASQDSDASAKNPLPRPLPDYRERGLSVRLATMDDLPFVDALQKRHSKQLGFFPRAQMEGYIRNGWMVIAEEVRDQKSEISLTSDLRPLTSGIPLGYCAFRDRYLKRDELGVIYQLCIEPNVQRKLIGAMLVKAVFERSAYGCDCIAAGARRI